MELYNQVKKDRDGARTTEVGKAVLRAALESLLILLSPFTPHLCEELWERTGHRETLARFPWPAFDPELASEEKVTVVVQVNGRLRDKFEADPGITEEEMKRAALDLERIQGFVGDRAVRKVICVENRLVNIVV
jgi:leucyl-tRNA synthetase